MVTAPGSISPAAGSTALDAWPADARDPLISSPAPLRDGSARIARRAMPPRSRRGVS